jgi:microcystin-dependent protein
MAVSIVKPTVGGSESTWGATINAGLDTIADALNGTVGTVAPNLSTLTMNGTDVTATAAELNTASTHYVPRGGIILYSGSTLAIPTGWVLCNGTNSTPDLRNRFVVGAGSLYAVGDTGGSSYVALSTANLPAHTHSSGTLGGSTNSAGSHTHSGTTNTTGSHTHGVLTYYDANANGNRVATAYANGGTRAYTEAAGDHSHTLSINSNGAHTHTVDVNSGNTGSKGSGTTHENRPPYYALAYIMKT